jgi:uncharacterized DUF497 family protein
MDLDFEWDEVKNRRNRAKHGIWFEEARTVFDDPLARLFLDDTSDDERYVLVGLSMHSGLLVVVHEYQESESIIRIISARLATRQEREFHEKTV